MTSSWLATWRQHRTRVACLLLVGCGLASLYPLQRAIDLEHASIEARRPEILFLPSGPLLRRVAGGYAGLLAVVYWTRAVQYYGRQRLAAAKNFPLLGTLLTIATDLDPHLLVAYRFGSVFLAGKPPEGAGRPQDALHLLQRGIVANPDYWRLWEDLGFIYYWDLKDYSRAARAFRTGSERPGALPWMRVLAASVAAKGGDIQTSRLLWEEIAHTAGNASIRRSAEEHLAALDALEALNKIDALLSDYRQRQGREAGSIANLVGAGYLAGFPLDPSGEPFVVGPDGRARLGPSSKIDLKLAQ
jgi:hypothetical protein